MRISQWFISTLKEVPNDAEIISHQLMLRAGMIKKLGAGLYTWLPLGLKVLQKIEAIVREEMNQSGAIEILMPAIQPAELWQETGRWDAFGGQLLTMKDNNEREYCFGPTHEEVVTDIMRQTLQSYKQLPLTVYQIQTKFRDEIRPRFGVMRAREFIMKDAYSFHLNTDSLQKTYQIMFETYSRILSRMGLNYRAVEADTGAIGGAVSHEFQVLADAGEDLIFYSDQSAYAANIEQATSLPPTSNATPHPSDAFPLTCVATPEQKTVAEVAQFLQIKTNQILKTLIVEGKDIPYVALVIKGDDTLNEIKAMKLPHVKTPLRFATDEEIYHAIKTPVGSIGPINLPIPTFIDHHVVSVSSFVCGANKAGHHFIYGHPERDLALQITYDLRNVKSGDNSPDGQGTLHMCRGIEVGHVFQLGEKYAEAMKATVTDEQGHPKVLTMGCYGLGISRLVAATIEQYHDDQGIIWPKPLAPFDISLIPLNYHRSSLVQEITEKVYHGLKQQGFDVLLDDRNERPGVLFADHDLMGIPHRLVISERLLTEQCIEYKARASQTIRQIPLDKLFADLKREIQI